MAILLLAACGVKKTAVPAEAEKASEPIHSPITDSLAQAGTAVDSLAFLGDLVNDSSIHINWVHGIPFIIDDSVPMLLPPIDKNPQGYVSNKNYEKIQRLSNRGEKITVCGVLNPVDSLLWLNKCVNDIIILKDSSLLPISHAYVYTLFLYSFEDKTSIYLLGVNFFPDWSCIADNTHKKIIEIIYVFDCRGNLLGKTYANQPIEWHNTKRIGEVGKPFPQTEYIFSVLQKKCKRQMLLSLSFIKYDPEYDCESFDDVIKL